MLEKFKQDAARWITPGQIGDPALLTFGLIVRLLHRHMALRAMAWYRLACWCQARRIPYLYGAMLRWIMFRFGLEIWGEIEGGLYIAHPVGTVIGARHMGRNCSVIAAVTVGLRNEYAFPTIGDNVFIGAGARVLGGIHVGDGAKIGANAVVVHDVAPGTTVVGIPARPIQAATPATSPDELFVVASEQLLTTEPII
jgi:serine O-acetyltransferase